jgi:hypothetical protein
MKTNLIVFIGVLCLAYSYHVLDVLHQA